MPGLKDCSNTGAGSLREIEPCSFATFAFVHTKAAAGSDVEDFVIEPRRSVANLATDFPRGSGRALRVF
jgi:hypothetical protein